MGKYVKLVKSALWPQESLVKIKSVHGTASMVKLIGMVSIGCCGSFDSITINDWNLLMVKYVKEDHWKVKNNKKINRNHKSITKKKRRKRIRRSWKKEWLKRSIRSIIIKIDDRARDVKVNDVIWIINAKHDANKIDAYQWKLKEKEGLRSYHEIS